MRLKRLFVLSLPCLFLTGTVIEAQNPNTKSVVIIPMGDSVRVLNDSISLVLKRVRSTKKGAVIGAIAGGSVGLVGGTILASNMSTIFGGRRSSFPKALGTGVLIGAGGALSWGLIGAGVGSLISREEWARVKVRGTSVSVSF